MLSNNLYFIHNFDEKMHYLIYHSLLKIEKNDGISIHDSTQYKKCTNKRGRWNFIVGDVDYSCVIYRTLEFIRQGICSIMKRNKTNIDIALVSPETNSDICYILTHDQESKSYIDVERLKKNNEHCGCDTKIHKRIFFKVVQPVLVELLKNTNYQLTSKILIAQA